MLTSVYYAIQILQGLFSGICVSLPGGYTSRSLLMGMLGKMAVNNAMTITDMARLFGVSRQAVYWNIHRLSELADKIKPLEGKPVNCLLVTDQDIDKAILSLSLDGHVSIEGIQRVLPRIYGASAQRSTGYISGLLNRAGVFAEEITKSISLANITQGANDEIFDNHDNPVFTGVDVESTYIYLMLDMYDRKGETWELAMETLKDSGLNLKVAISDGGNGLLKGIKAAFPGADIQIDVFHVLRDIGRAVYSFQGYVIKALAAYYKSEKSLEKKKPWHKKFATEKRKFAKIKVEINPMVEDYDTITCLYSWLHELIAFSGYSYDEVMELMDWLLAEMDVITRRYSWAYNLKQEIPRFKDRLPETMRFLHRLFGEFSRTAEVMGLPEKAFHLLYRRLGVDKESEAYMHLTKQVIEMIGSEHFEAVEKVLGEVVGRIKRASSLVENVNNRLRAYMNIKKHISTNFYQLIQLHLNTKKYRRSRVKSRKGRSPVELLTGEEWPELIDLLEERGFWSDRK